MHVSTTYIGKEGGGRDRDGVGNVLDGSHHPPLSVGTLLMIPNSPLALSSPLGEDLSPFNIGQKSASSFPSGGVLLRTKHETGQFKTQMAFNGPWTIPNKRNVRNNQEKYFKVRKYILTVLG